MDQMNSVPGANASIQNSRSPLAPLLCRHLLVPLVIGALISLVPAPGHPADGNLPHKRILFVYSNSPDFPVYSLLTAGFTEQIRNQGKLHPEYFYEYLEWNRWSENRAYHEAVTDFWRQKYARKQIDLIVLFGDPAAHFMRTRSERIFPGVPVIFTGNTLLGFTEADFPANFVALLATVDLRLSVELILRVQPTTRRIYLILGDSDVERRRAADAQERLRALAGQVELVFLNTLPFAQLLERVRTVEKDSVIFFVNFLQDVEKNLYVPAKILETIHRASPVPIYGTSDTFLGSGSIGGYVTSSALAGRRAATHGTAILLTGKLPDSRVETGAGSEYIFNWRELKRWGVDVRRLPPGSKLEFKDPEAWELYRWHIVGTIGLFCAMASLIAGLLVTRSRRKHTEIALRESETNYRSLFHNAPVGIFHSVPAGRFLRVNPALARMLGYGSPEEMVSSVTDIGTEIYIESRARAEVMAATRDSTGWVYAENRYRRKDGTITIANLSLRKVLGTDGTVAYLEGFVEDITERKQAEAALHRSHALLESTFASLRDALFILDTEGRVVDCNPMAVTMFGIPREVLRGQTTASLHVDAAALATFQATVQAAVAREGFLDGFEFQMRRRNGEVFPTDHTVVPLVDAQGTRGGWVSRVRDLTARLTERRLAEGTLRRSEERYRTLFNQANDAIWILELEGSDAGCIRLANPAAARMHGYTIDEMQSLRITDLDIPDSVALAAERFASIRRGEWISGETLHVRKDGATVPVEFSAGPIDFDGRPCVLAFARDVSERKQAEHELRAVTQRLRHATASAKAGVWDWDIVTGEMIWDDRMLELYGLTRQSFPGGIKAWEQGLHPDDSARAIAECEAALKGVRDFDTEFRVRHPDGAVIDIKANGLVLRDTQGRAVRMIGLNIDLTDRKQLEEKYRILFDAAQDGIALADLETGTLLDCNDSLCRLVGCRKDELIGQKQAVLHPPQELFEGASRTFQAHKASPSGHPLEDILVTKDGRSTPVEIHASQLQLNGRATMLGLFRDITERKRAEAALRARTAQLEALRAVGAELARELELDSLFRLVVRHALALIQAEAGGVNLWDAAAAVVVPAAWEGTLAQWAPTVRYRLGEGVVGQVAATREGCCVNAYRTSSYAHPTFAAQGDVAAVLAEPMLYQGRLLGVLALARGGQDPRPFTPADQELLRLFTTQAAIAIENARLYTEAQAALAAQAQAQAELVRTEKLRGLGQMAAGIAHDLNNTLATVLGQVEIAGHALVPPDLQEVLTAIETAASDGAATVKRIQEFARPRGTSPLAPCALAPLVRETLEITRPRWQAEPQRRGVPITVTTALPADLPPILGYPPELREALTNLLFNAVDAMPHGGALTFRGTAAAETVTLAITDTGVGMPPAIQAKVFEPFFTTKGVQGTGLGLAVVYGILERHGGHIAVASALGQGTTFTLTFQRAPETAAPARPAEAPSPLPASRRLLVVDDEPGVRRTLARLLTLAGHQVVEAPDGPQALALLATTPVECVLTDLGMPEMNGWALARQVKAAHPRLPVILLTGWRDQAEGDEGDRAAVDAILGKPVKLPALLEAIERVGGSGNPAPGVSFPREVGKDPIEK